MRREFARFMVVGALGFIVDASVLQLLISGFEWSPFTARALSFPVAVTATFALNSAWTFRAGLRTSPFRAYGAYTAIQLVGALLNLAVFSACLLWVPVLRERPVIALAVGSVVAMLFNFLSSRQTVFRARRESGNGQA